MTCWAFPISCCCTRRPRRSTSLTEAAPVERFASLRRDLAALYAGYYIAELLTDLTDFHDPHPKLFDAATITLRHLGDPALRPRRVLRFELACLRELGLMPALDACAHCGAAVDASGRRVRVRPGDRRRALPRLPARPAARGDALGPDPRGDPRPGGARAAPGATSTPAPRRSAPVRATLGAVISHLLGRRPRLLPYLGV